MTTVAHGPYEHVGAYAALAESEVFDTSGTDILFCAYCEHAPCVAGGNGFCAHDPRFITAEHYARGIVAAAGQLHSPLNRAFTIAIAAVARAAWDKTPAGEAAMRSLVKIRAKVRRAVRS